MAEQNVTPQNASATNLDGETKPRILIQVTEHRDDMGPGDRTVKHLLLGEIGVIAVAETLSTVTMQAEPRVVIKITEHRDDMSPGERTVKTEKIGQIEVIAVAETLSTVTLQAAQK